MTVLIRDKAHHCNQLLCNVWDMGFHEFYAEVGHACGYFHAGGVLYLLPDVDEVQINKLTLEAFETGKLDLTKENVEIGYLWS